VVRQSQRNSGLLDPECEDLTASKFWYSLTQASATYGTRAKRGTWNDFQWHAE